MEPTIRALASHRGNLFVLEEYNPLEWLIKSYRGGFDELKDRTQNFFWFELSLPILKNRAIIEEQWGLNLPIYQRYLNWAIPLFTRFDFGISITFI